MPKALLQHLTEAEIQHELRGFPDRAIAAVLALKQESSTERLQVAIPEILSFYLPRGVSTDLTRAELPGTDHWLHHQKPAEVAELISGFVARVEAA